jgi:hypothetical protein
VTRHERGTIPLRRGYVTDSAFIDAVDPSRTLLLSTGISVSPVAEGCWGAITLASDGSAITAVRSGTARVACDDVNVVFGYDLIEFAE